MEINDPLVFLGLSKSHWIRSYSETSDEAKLLRLMAGFNSLVRDSNKKIIEFKEVVDKVSDIKKTENQILSKHSEEILWQSYYERCNILHGRFYKMKKIQELVPKLQLLLRDSIEIMSLRLEELPECYHAKIVSTEVVNDG